MYVINKTYIFLSMKKTVKSEKVTLSTRKENIIILKYQKILLKVGLSAIPKISS